MLYKLHSRVEAKHGVEPSSDLSVVQDWGRTCCTERLPPVGNVIDASLDQGLTERLVLASRIHVIDIPQTVEFGGLDLSMADGQERAELDGQFGSLIGEKLTSGTPSGSDRGLGSSSVGWVEKVNCGVCPNIHSGDCNVR